MSANGQVYRDPFPEQHHPAEPCSIRWRVKIQNLFPAAAWNGIRHQQLHSQHSHHARTRRFRLSKSTRSSAARAGFPSSGNAPQTTAPISATFGQIDGLPDPLATNLGTFQNAPLYRLNYDYTLSPTILLHFGAGYRSNYFFVPTVNEEGQVPNYNASAELGLQGRITNKFFPPFSNVCAGAHDQLLRRSGRHDEFRRRRLCRTTSRRCLRSTQASPGSVAIIRTKFGAEFRTEGYPAQVQANTSGSYGFSPNQTGPYPTGATVNQREPAGLRLMPVSCWVWSTTSASPTPSIRVSARRYSALTSRTPGK